MTKSSDQSRLQNLQTNVLKLWKPKETVVLPDDFIFDESGKLKTSESSKLKTSDSLSFLKEEKKTENIFENSNWDLNDEKGKIPPLKFSNNKTQEDIVSDILNLIKDGTRIIFLHGACGTGKCLDKETLIFCKPDGKSCFSYYKISDIVDKEGEILSLDKKGNIISSKFKNVRETGTKKLFKMKTNTGREIIASENHPFLTINQYGVSWNQLNKLNNKSFICLPNHINIQGSEDLSDSKLKILGHLISEGKLGDKAGSPGYYQDKTITPLIRQDYIDALKQEFPEGKIRDSHKTEVRISFNNKNTTFGTTNKLKLFIRKFGLDGKKSADKFVPEIIFNLSEKKIAIFIQALFSGDGSIYSRKNKQIVIEYSSISKRLINDISVLLIRFGIQHTITNKKFRDNLEYSWRITISNHENIRRYIEKIGFLGEKQVLALSLLLKCKIHKFTNIDKVPRIIREYLKNKGYAYNELDRMLNYEEIERLRKSIGFKKIKKNKLTLTPQVFRQGKIDFLRTHIKKVNEYIKDDTLSLICNEQILWDKIKSIELLKEDVTYDLEVPEMHNFIANGIIVHNSAIALNVARKLGRSSIIVPVKTLQRQYEEDYTEKKFLCKPNGEKMKIAVMTGRENHDSIINKGISCADPELPENIKISEKNYVKIAEYFKNNPFVSGQDMPDYKHIRRLSIAPANPYWSPIVPSTYELNQIKDAKKVKYLGCDGREYTFYHRKPGCSYYDQYLAYKNADVIIFNGAKYKAELALGRKPATEIEIIDEADEFLDSLFQQDEINLTRLGNNLSTIIPESLDSKETIRKIVSLIGLEEQNKRALGIDEGQVYNLDETRIREIFKLLAKDKELESEILLDENNYSNRALEISRNLEEMTEEVYLSYRKEEESLYIKLVSTNLSQKIQELLEKSKVLLLMSGTLHSEKVIKNIFGMNQFKVIRAETLNQGAIEIVMTGKEKDCKYSNFSDGQHSRKEYLEALNLIVERSKKPSLIHVNAFQDLPTEDEKSLFNLKQLTTQENLRETQSEDKTGRTVSIFKQGLNDKLFTTKCSRGIDFPGNMCNSVIFTKYPNPNISDTFWKILQKTHPDNFWEFYRDKAYREFLQRIYRAVRSKDDHVYIMSPDLRVLQSVKKLQNEGNNNR